MPSLELPTETTSHPDSVRRNWLPCRSGGQPGIGKDWWGLLPGFSSPILQMAKGLWVKETEVPALPIRKAPGKQEQSTASRHFLTLLLVPTFTEPYAWVSPSWELKTQRGKMQPWPHSLRDRTEEQTDPFDTELLCTTEKQGRRRTTSSDLTRLPSVKAEGPYLLYQLQVQGPQCHLG